MSQRNFKSLGLIGLIAAALLAVVSLIAVKLAG